MNKKLIALAIAAVLVVPAYAVKPTKQVETIKPVDIVAVITKEFEKVPLKDPASLQLRNLITYTNGVTCGEFNAKNSMGGYVGFEPFVRDPAGNITARIVVGPDLIRMELSSYCADGNFSIQHKEVSIKKLEFDIKINNRYLKTDKEILDMWSKTANTSELAQREFTKYSNIVDNRVKKGAELEKQLLELTEGVK